MKWHNHIGITAALIYAATHDGWAAALSAAGTVFPDVIEGKDFDRRIHRTISHWFPPYALVAVLSSVYLVLRAGRGDVFSLIFVQHGVGVSIMAAFLYKYMAIGAILHICQDALCGKVPLFIPTRREFGITLFRVGSVREYALSFAAAGGLTLVAAIF